VFDLIGQATSVVAAAFTVNANNLQKRLRPPGQAAMQKRPKYQNSAARGFSMSSPATIGLASEPREKPARSKLPASLIALVLMWLFLLSPMIFQPLLSNGRGRIDLLYLFNLITTVLWTGALHFSVRRPVVLHALLIPFYLATAVDLFLMATLEIGFLADI
jgi:hypothetical protein